MARKPRLTIEHNPTGWPRNDGRQDGLEECRSVLARRARGLNDCTNTAIWKTSTRGRGYVRTGWYCDEDLPAEARAALNRR